MDIEVSETRPKAEHLCVLVHGLWGNPSHLDFVSKSLRKRYDEDHIYILAAKQNAGNFTYDGIELGGERLALEIESTLETLAEKGYNIRKFSIVGYSLGGLVARYALGLLNARGWLDKLEPVNFTTFVTPHVGVRTPLKGLRNLIWNVLGARTISISGRQLFMIDSFRDTEKPLLSVLADPESIFIQALGKFRKRSAYANIVNDRSAVFYTTGITGVDPFQKKLDDINFNYVKGYEPVVIDPDVHALPQPTKEPTAQGFHIGEQFTRIITKLPLWLFVGFIIPIAATVYLVNALVQTCRSRQRIRLHGEGKTGELFGGYKVPVIVQDVRQAMEDVFENVNARQDVEYLSTSSSGTRRRTRQSTSSGEKAKSVQSKTEVLSQEVPASISSAEASEDEITPSAPSPTLALTPAQFAIIDSLNAVGFHKYPVYIHNHRHSHAAIIVRKPKKEFEEGETVIKHWLDNEFEV